MMLYIFAFLFSLIFLSLWFIFQKNESLSQLFSYLFLAGFFVYLLFVLWVDASIELKVQTLIRDFFVLSGTAIFINLFKQNKQVLFGIIAGLSIVFSLFYVPILRANFVEQDAKTSIEFTPRPSNIPLDNNWELLVDLEDGKEIGALKEVIATYQLQTEKAFVGEHLSSSNLNDYYAINIPSAEEANIEAIKTAIYATRNIDFLEENEVFKLAPIPNKSPKKVHKKFGINDPDLDKMWGFEMMEVDKLFRYLRINNIRPKRKAKIFIIDSGVDAQHPDLKAKYVSIKKYNDSDKNGHGTHCAGIAAAITNNNMGIASLSPNNDFVSVTGVKVMSPAGIGTQRNIIQGMIDAADNQADVVSMSLGSRSTDTSQKAFGDAVAYINKAGGIVLAAAGNANMSSKSISPAGVKNVIAVSAIDTLGNRASFSNYVQEVEMGIAAPGVEIYSTIPDNQYKSYSGTSMACPNAAGLVGLLRSLDPNLNTKAIFNILQKTGKETGNTKETGKLIYPVEAVKRVLQPSL